MKLPIYHGTDDGVLSHAVGHIKGSSLPVGGESTHCALSARRGLPIIFVLMLSVLLLTTVAEAANKPNTAVDVSRSCTLTLQYAASGQAVRLYRAADISPAGLYTLLCAARCWRVSRRTLSRRTSPPSPARAERPCLQGFPRGCIWWTRLT